MSQRSPLKNVCCVFLSLCFFIIGCGGHQPNCVDRYMPGDEKRSCASLMAEIQTIDNEITQKDGKRKERDMWNAVYFVGGVFIIVPFFFMDAKGSYEAEMAALEARQKQLKIFFADNGCSVSDMSNEPVAGK